MGQAVMIGDLRWLDPMVVGLAASGTTYSWFGPAALANALLGALVGFLESVGFAVNGDDFGVV